MTFFPGHTQTKPYLFDEAGIIAFAAASGDLNALHRDAAISAKTRFKGIIASGAQMTAVLMGFGASMLSRDHESVGLEFSFRFGRAIPAGTDTILSWTITSTESHAKLGGTMLLFEGAISGTDGKRYMAASAKAVVWDKLGQSG